MQNPMKIMQKQQLSKHLKQELDEPNDKYARRNQEQARTLKSNAKDNQMQNSMIRFKEIMQDSRKQRLRKTQNKFHANKTKN